MHILVKYKSIKWLKAFKILSLCGRCHRKYVGTATHMSANQIRKSFINYFVGQHQHSFVQSSRVMPENDPSLLFISAGMNQFKDIFQNRLPLTDPRLSLKRCVNSQKCIRVGGKHCDLSTVGTDGRHHTFFEMLGNWSFGDYYKKESCLMAWNLLTEVFKLDAKRLIVTYFGGDQSLGLGPDLETRDIWLSFGLPEYRILPLGAKENFWEMAETGPCGICTEIHYQLEPNPTTDAQSLLDNSIEIWNIVFMQFDRLVNELSAHSVLQSPCFRKADGKLDSLHKHFVDTGMGLERITSVIQNVKSNYETDLFAPYFQVIQKASNCRPYSSSYTDQMDISYRILADHSRMYTIAISDGLTPSYRGAGYVLRKIIRKSLGIAANDFGILDARQLLKELVITTETLLSEAFPELSQNVKHINEVITEEIDRYDSVVLKNRQIVGALKQLNVEYSINFSDEIVERMKRIELDIDLKANDKSMDKTFLDKNKKYLFTIKDLISDYSINLRHNLPNDLNERVDIIIDRIEELENQITTSFLQEMQSNVSKDSQFVVYEIQTRGHTKLAFKIGLDCFGHKPTALFHKTNDGNEFFIQTTVPSAYQKYMTANEWLTKIANKLKSFEVMSNKRVKKISSLKSHSIEQLDEAMTFAEDIARQSFSKQP